MLFKGGKKWWDREPKQPNPSYLISSHLKSIFFTIYRKIDISSLIKSQRSLLPLFKALQTLKATLSHQEADSQSHSFSPRSREGVGKWLEMNGLTGTWKPYWMPEVAEMGWELLKMVMRRATARIMVVGGEDLLRGRWELEGWKRRRRRRRRCLIPPSTL